MTMLPTITHPDNQVVLCVQGRDRSDRCRPGPSWQQPAPACYACKSTYTHTFMFAVRMQFLRDGLHARVYGSPISLAVAATATQDETISSHEIGYGTAWSLWHICSRL